MSVAGNQSSFDLLFEPIPESERPDFMVPAPGEGNWDNLPDVGPTLAPFDFGGEEQPAVVSPDGERIVGKGGMVLDGDVLACPCPDCTAPMSIRTWLMVADCWRCDTAIELSEEQEREAMRLIHQRDAARARKQGSPKPKPTAAPTKSPASVPEPKKSSPQAPAEKKPQEKPATPPPTPGRRARRVSAASQPIGVRRRIRRMAAGGTLSVMMHEWFKDLPAWVISGLLHMALLMLLGLLSLSQEEPSTDIVLSEVVGNERISGGAKIKDEDGQEFDVIMPPEKMPKTEQEKKLLVQAAKDAKMLEQPRNMPDFSLPPIQRTLQQINSGNAKGGLLSRDPRVRRQMIKQEGGTTLTEAAVARGLSWIAKQQNPKDGSWSFRGEKGGTGLALLSMLGANQTIETGHYQKQVSLGVRFLLSQQKKDGFLGTGASHEQMYIHPQATMALCELFALTGEESAREPAQRAIDFIVNNQYKDGGWRYARLVPGNSSQRGDTSVVGWQLMALLSAKLAGLDVPDKTFTQIDEFLDTVQKKTDETRKKVTEGSRYGYMHNGAATHTMTAEGLLCRQYLGWPASHPAFRSGAKYFLEKHPPNANALEMYYCYYATQVMHHLGGSSWKQWNEKMRDVLVQKQEHRGANAGSWPVLGPHAGRGGRLYTTTMAVCMLEVYYRHLPLYRKVSVQ